jgi:hypothetical protein
VYKMKVVCNNFIQIFYVSESVKEKNEDCRSSVSHSGGRIQKVNHKCNADKYWGLKNGRILTFLTALMVNGA